jgi:hypothetical protein
MKANLRPSHRVARRTALAVAAMLLLPPAVSHAELPMFYTASELLWDYGGPGPIQPAWATPPWGVTGLDNAGRVVTANGLGPSMVGSGGRMRRITDDTALLGGVNRSGGIGLTLYGYREGDNFYDQFVAVRATAGGVSQILSPRDAQGRLIAARATGINDGGWIVGTVGSVGFGDAVLWDPAGNMQRLGGSWRPSAINNQRQVVGIGTNGSTNFKWDAQNGVSFLPGRNALDIDDQGRVLLDDNGWGVFTPGVGTTHLAALPGSFATVAMDMNGLGQVVGYASFQLGQPHPAGPLARPERLAFWHAGAAGAPVDVLSMARFGGGTLANLPVDGWNAVALNDGGQMVVTSWRLASERDPITGQISWHRYSGRSFLLSPCLRCGQIKPNPNPAGQTLQIGSDWENAFNAEDYQNIGTIALATRLDHRPGRTLFNRGSFIVFEEGTMQQDGFFDNEAGAVLSIRGAYTARGRLTNHGSIGVIGNPTGPRLVMDADWFNARGSRVIQQAGEIVLASGDTTFREATLESAADFRVGQRAALWLQGAAASFDFTFDNAGRVYVDSLGNSPARLTLRGAAASNAHLGKIVVLSGSLALERGTRLQNNGLIDISGDSRLELAQGRIDNGLSAELNVAPAATLAMGDGARVANRGRMAIEGTVTFADGAQLLNTEGTVLVAGSLALRGRVSGVENGVPAVAGQPPSQAELVMRRGSSLEMDRMTLVLNHGRLSLMGQVSMASQADIVNEGNLLIGETAQVLGQGGFSQGVGGALTRIDGRTEWGSFEVLAGTLTGNGSVRASRIRLGSGVMAADAQLRIGSSPGTMVFDGDVELDGVDIEIEAGDHARFDRMVVTGTASFANTTVTFKGWGGYAPDLNDSFEWLASAGGASGLENVAYRVEGLPAGWSTQVGSDGRIGLSYDAAIELPAAPLPAGYRVQAGEVAYLSAARGAGYPLDGLQIDGALALHAGTEVQAIGQPLRIAAGGRLSTRGTLELASGWVNSGRFDLYAGATLTSWGSVVNDGRMVLAGTVNNAARFENQAGGHVEVLGRWSNSEGATLLNRGRLTVVGTLTANGDVENVGGRLEVQRGGRIELTPPADATAWLVQTGVEAVTRVDGEIVAQALRIEEGVLEGSGRVEAVTVLGVEGASSARVRPGGEREVGQLELSFAQAASAVFEIDIAGTDSLDQLRVPSSLNVLQGEIDFVLLRSYVPALGDNFEWLAGASLARFGLDRLSWSVSQVQADGSLLRLGGSDGFDAGQPLRLAFDGERLTVTAVPEPGTWALMLLGAAGIAARLRRANQAWNSGV